MIQLICQSLLNKKGKTILLLIQFIIGMLALSFGLSVMQQVKEYERCVGKIAPLESVHMNITSQDELAESDPNLVIQYEKIFNQLKERGYVNKMGLFQLLNIYTQEENQVDKLYVLNEDSLSMQKYDLQKGDMNELIRYKDSNLIPVIVSDSMQSTYQFGKEYDFFYNDAESEPKSIHVKVVGVLPKNDHFWMGGSSYISENILNNKDFMIAPSFTEFKEESVYVNNALLVLSENPHALEQIEQLFSENKIDVEFVSLEEETRQYYETQKTIVMGMLLFATILLVMSLLGSVGAILTSISMRYREFGIYYSLGVGKDLLMKLVLGEIMCIYVISFMISTVICYVCCQTVLSDFIWMNWTVGVEVFIVMMICCLLSSLLPFFKMRKIEPVDLLKGINN